jgi:hypothetical protein
MSIAFLADKFFRSAGLLTQVPEGGGESWSESAIAIAGIAMVTVIAAVAIWQVFASWRARMSIAREEAYRKLAEESATTQRRLLDLQDSLLGAISDVRTRVTGIEQTLRQID